MAAVAVKTLCECYFVNKEYLRPFSQTLHSDTDEGGVRLYFFCIFLTKRLIEHSTDEHLDLMLTGGPDGEHLKQHVHHHRRKLHHKDIHGKTIWNWTWTHRLTPFAGHTRTEMLSSCGLPNLPLLPQAPN